MKAAAAKKAAPAAKKAAAPAKKAVPAKAAPQVTITLKQIAAELAEGHDLPKKLAEAVLGDLVTLAAEHLKKGDKIRLTGLGILQVRSREARMGRNPATGRIHRDRGQQEDRVPAGEGTQGGRVGGSGDGQALDGDRRTALLERVDRWAVWEAAARLSVWHSVISDPRPRGYPESGLACVAETAGMGTGECDCGRTNASSHMTVSYPNA